MRNYTLITGATGLLGAYLLRNFLICDVPCAVLVRSTRFASARQRVESILARWEKAIGRVLPRPVVLEGSLSENLGLDAEKTDWVRRRCARLVHNAASLAFERIPETNEPYRSNVDGTRYAVEFALKCGIPQFHHVSTAYVCGLRDGVCYESELDVGQDWGNDYERAKVAAEKIVRSAPFAEPPTFYRPGIITGDSVTGYTSTYHGFYTPLKVVAPIQLNYGFKIPFESLFQILGMEGYERKNFTPVEWIGQAIVALANNPRNVGKTFHLTPRERVTVGRMYEIFSKSIRKRLAQKDASEAAARRKATVRPEVLEATLSSIRDQMGVYRSYWRDDPVFDLSNTNEALPNLPCPEMNEDVLTRLTEFALDANFGWPKPKPLYPEAFADDFFVVKPTFRATERPSFVASLEVRGVGGGAWSATIRNGRVEAFEEGLDPDADAKLTTNARTFAYVRFGQATPEQALASGAILWEARDAKALPSENAARFLAYATRR